METGQRKVRGSQSTLGKGSASKLCTALLSLWAHGKLSGTTCRWLAEQAILDGLLHDELAGLARCGNHGENPNNIHRDMMAQFVKDCVVPPHRELQIMSLHPKTLKKEEDTCAVFLPHELFADLSKLENFRELFPIDQLETFWSRAEETGDERLVSHPMKGRNWKKFTVPLFLHGDGVQYASNNSLMVYSWGGLLTCFQSLQSKFLLACYPKNCTAEETWPKIMTEVCWSFAALLDGRWPTHDSSNKPLKKGDAGYELRGKPLANGFKGVIWCVMGDAEFYANSLHLAHWASKEPCFECDCKSSPDNLSKWVKNIDVPTQDFCVVSNEEAAARPSSAHLLFHRIPGLTTKFVRGDALHILWVHGVVSHLLGSVLFYLCWYDYPAKQAKPPADRLGVVWGQIQDAYKLLQSPTRLSNLRLSMFTDPKRPHTSYPSLAIKGGEAKHFLPALLHVARTLLQPGIWHERCMLDAMDTMANLIRCFDQSDVFLTKKEWQEAYTLGKGFLDAYNACNQWAQEEGRQLFNIVFKHHSFCHLVDNSRYINPRCHWCWSNEDFVGKISLLTFSVSPGVGASRLSLKVAPKYRILLHLLLQRDGFLDTTKEFSDLP